MRVTFFNGSHRGRSGNTARVVDEVLAGAAAAGAEVRHVVLAEHRLLPCAACLSCWTAPSAACRLDDDMAALLAAVREADVLGLATPVYVDNVSGLMKLFIDRLIPLLDPHYEPDGHGETRHPKLNQAGARLALVATCAYPETSHFAPLDLFFRRLARNFRSTIVARIYRSQAEVLRAHPSGLDPAVAAYGELLRRAGRELVERGAVDAATERDVAAPLMPADEYLAGANAYWDRRLRARGGRSS